MATLTTMRGHGMQVGDTLRFTTKTRWQRLGQLLRRPRITCVTKVTSVTALEYEERRMTWAEWRKELWALIGGA